MFWKSFCVMIAVSVYVLRVLYSSSQTVSSVSVTDSLATWYLRVMAATVTACLPLLPQLQNIILQHSRWCDTSRQLLTLSAFMLRCISHFAQHTLEQQQLDVTQQLWTVLLTECIKCAQALNLTTKTSPPSPSRGKGLEMMCVCVFVCVLAGLHWIRCLHCHCHQQALRDQRMSVHTFSKRLTAFCTPLLRMCILCLYCKD